MLLTVGRRSARRAVEHAQVAAARAAVESAKRLAELERRLGRATFSADTLRSLQVRRATPDECGSAGEDRVVVQSSFTLSMYLTGPSISPRMRTRMHVAVAVAVAVAALVVGGRRWRL
jgi:hypothetical protein